MNGWFRPRSTANGDDFEAELEFHGATEHFGFDDCRSFVSVDFLDFTCEAYHGSPGDENLSALNVAFGKLCTQVFIRDTLKKFDFGIAKRLEVAVVFENTVEGNKMAQAFADDGWVPLEDEIPREHGADLFVPSTAITPKPLNGEKHNFRRNSGEGEPTDARRFAFIASGDLKCIPGIHIILFTRKISH